METYYLTYEDENEPYGLYEIKDDKTIISFKSTDIDINQNNNPRHEPFLKWYNESKQKEVKEIKSSDGRIVRIEKFNLNRGEFHPRIYRPIYNHRGRSFLRRSFSNFDIFEDDINGLEFENTIRNDLIQTGMITLAHFETYTNLLKKIFLSIFPSTKNFSVFGHEIRNLIILCATEAEAQMKGVLKANQYQTSKKYWNTTDYVKLCDILKLREYAVKLRYYPDVPPIKPFIDWDKGNPTQTLRWYANYNSIKHDRENSLELGTLESGLEALCACIILFIAQFGETSNLREVLGDYFEITEVPKFAIKEAYLSPGFSENKWICILKKI